MNALKPSITSNFFETKQMKVQFHYWKNKKTIYSHPESIDCQFIEKCIHKTFLEIHYTEINIPILQNVCVQPGIP